MLPGGEALPETEEDVSESDIDGHGRSTAVCVRFGRTTVVPIALP
jgi:hypothetical protein